MNKNVVMKKLNLKKLREVGDKATEGPWEYDGVYLGGNFYPEQPHFEKTKIPGKVTPTDQRDITTSTPEDGEFIREARKNWEAMIEALEEAYELIMNNNFENVRIDDESCYWLERFEDD